MSDETKPCVGCGRVHGARSPRGACDNCDEWTILVVGLAFGVLGGVWLAHA